MIHWLRYLRWTIRRSYREYLRSTGREEASISFLSPRVVAPEHLDRRDEVYLDHGVYIHCGHASWCPGQGGVVLGRGTYVGPYSVLFGMGEIEIGEDVMISPHVTITSVEHPVDDPSRPMYRQPRIYGRVVIGDDVYLGSGAVVTPGVTIGRGAVVGAGAVVTRDLPEYCVAMGVPARVVRSRVEPNAS